MTEVSSRSRGKVLLQVIAFWVGFIAILELPRTFLGLIPSNWVRLVWGCVVSGGTLALTLLFARIQRLSLRGIGIAPSNSSGPRLIVGLAIGFTIVAIQIAIVAACARMRVTLDARASVRGTLLVFATLLSTATMEELSFRGYPLRRLIESFDLWGGQFIVAAAFILYHHFAFGWDWTRAIVGTGLGSLLFGMAAIASRGIGMAIGIHAGVIFALWAFATGEASGIWKVSSIGVQPTGWQAQIGNVSYVVSFVIATLAFWIWYRRGVTSTKSMHS